MTTLSPSGFPAPNYTQVPNRFLDELLATIETAAELKVTLAVFRHTFGFHRRRDRISLTQLERETGMGRKAVVDGATKAVERGTLTKHATVKGSTYSVDVWFDDRTTTGSRIEPIGSSTVEPTKERGKERGHVRANGGTSKRRGRPHGAGWEKVFEDDGEG